MADVKISELTELSSANVAVDVDVLAIVDNSASATKKIAVENLLAPIVINKATSVITNLGTVTTADINGGTIDGAAIGGASASTGAFTTLSSTVTAAQTAFSVTSSQDASNKRGASFIMGGSNAGMDFGIFVDAGSNVTSGSVIKGISRHASFTGDLLTLDCDSSASGAVLINAKDAGTSKFKVLSTGATTINSNVTLSGSSASRYYFLNSGADGGLWQEGAYALRFGTSDNERMRIDSVGRVGIGVTPNSWDTANNFHALQVGTGASFAGSGSGTGNSQAYIGNNCHYDDAGNTWDYIGASQAQLFQLNDDGHLFYYNAGTGSGTAPITWLNRLTILNNGNVGIGTSSPSDLLHVTNGNNAIDTRIRIQAFGQLPIYNTYYASGTESSPTAPTADTEVLRMEAMTYDGNDYSQSAGRISIVAQSNHASDDAHSYMSFATCNDATRLSTEKLRITGEGAFHFIGGTDLDRAGLIENSASTFNFHASSSSLYDKPISFYRGNQGNDLILTLGADLSATFTGAVSKASGSFKIDHPLPSKNDTHYLVHSFTESPRADLIYRDKVTLVDGSATVNIDTVAGMTEGTFVLLCDNVQCFTSNESDWSAVKGSVSGNILTIECEDSSSTANIAWMVVGDRKDEHIMNTEWTDENGKPIIEPEKENA